MKTRQITLPSSALCLLSSVLCLLSSANAAHAALLWGNNGAITNEEGTAVASSPTDSTIGSFAQLIWAGPDETADPFVRSDTGVSDDDTVVATVFSAEDFFAAPMAGIFPMRVLPLGSSDSNKVYYVRVFNAPNPDYAEGNSAPAPLRATYFWQSATHAYEHNELLDDHWNFAPAGGQTLVRGMIASNDVPVWWLVRYDLTNDYDAAALGNQDTDPVPTDEEWIADTIPTNGDSFFRLTWIERTNSMAIMFGSSTARVYSLENSEMLDGGYWMAVEGQANVTGDASGMTTLIDTNDAAMKAYRVEVSLP